MSSHRPHSQRPVRRSVLLPCQVVRERDFRLVGRHLSDLSTEGMSVLIDRPVLTGEKLLIALKVPGTTSIWLDAEGEVRRVVHGRRPEDNGRAVGIELTWAAPDAMAMLQGQLAWFREARPKREPTRTHIWRSLYA